jgi:multidrug efflux pump
LEALVKAASQRLRPILMTTGAMVLGALCPWRWRPARGAESRIQIGWVIVGGMSLGTLLTIFVVPTMYMLFARKVCRAPTRPKPIPKRVTQHLATMGLWAPSNLGQASRARSSSTWVLRLANMSP